MIARVVCTCCNEQWGAQWEAPTYQELIAHAPTALLQAHAQDSAHSLRIDVAGTPDIDLVRHPMKLECLDRRCAGARPRATPVWETMAAVEEITMIALQFHSEHEGHRFRISWNGRIYEPP